MTEYLSGWFLSETEYEAGCSTKQSEAMRKSDRNEWLEQENNVYEFISCLLGEQLG